MDFRMTKTARVIWIFFIILSSVIFTSKVSAGFGELLKPIPDDFQLPTTNYQPLTFNQPPVTFGDLLNNTSLVSPTPINHESQVLGDSTEIAEKTARFKQLLAQLETSYQTSLSDFQSQQQMTPKDIPYVLDHPTPTPFIPIPTLVAGVSELANLNPPTTNYQPPTNFPTPTLTDYLLLASLNKPAIIQPSPSPIPPTTEIGALNQNPVIKTSFTIALLGDSMTDTLGRSLPQLRSLLQNAYPHFTFSLLNYGQGATDLESGLNRLTNSTDYLGTSYPPLLSYKPDILVVESFAYNHWSGEKYDLDRQWLDYAKIVDTVRQNSPQTKIVFASTIAPNKNIFGDGVLNWPQALKEQSAIIIKAYLQNMINFATSEHYPLSDAYHPSLDAYGNGLPQYINGGDHLHPSGDGGMLYSQKIVDTIKSNGLIYQVN